MNVSKGFGSINQVLAEIGMKGRTWLHQSAICSEGFGNQSMQETEVICPEPRRASRNTSMLDGLERFTCKQRSVDTLYGDGLNINDFLSCKDNMEGEFDDSHPGYFYGTPPERAGNPLIHDQQFIRQSFSPVSPLGVGNTHLGLPSLPFDWDSPSSCASPFSSKIRIEGFPSDKNAKRGSVLSARA